MHLPDDVVDTFYQDCVTAGYFQDRPDESRSVKEKILFDFITRRVVLKLRGIEDPDGKNSVNSPGGLSSRPMASTTSVSETAAPSLSSTAETYPPPKTPIECPVETSGLHYAAIAKCPSNNNALPASGRKDPKSRATGPPTADTASPPLQITPMQNPDSALLHPATGGPSNSNTLSGSKNAPSDPDTPLSHSAVTDSPAPSSPPGFLPDFSRLGVSDVAESSKTVRESLEALRGQGEMPPGKGKQVLAFDSQVNNEGKRNVLEKQSEVAKFHGKGQEIPGIDSDDHDEDEGPEFVDEIWEDIVERALDPEDRLIRLPKSDKVVSSEDHARLHWILDAAAEPCQFHGKGKEIFDDASEVHDEDERRLSKTPAQLEEEEAWEMMIAEALDPHDGLIELDDIGSHSQEDMEGILELWNRGPELLKKNFPELEHLFDILFLIDFYIRYGCNDLLKIPCRRTIPSKSYRSLCAVI
jgi:hypothetical protein